MATNSFFEESGDQSQVKAAIVSKYFWAWAKVIIPWAKGSGKIAYLDLFAGPGRYKDGTKSTPLLILEKAIAEPDLRRMLVAVFNDRDTNSTQSLQLAIEELPGIETLRHKPKVYSEEVGERLVNLFETMRMVPTLFFVDPWGYKGLSLRLVNSAVQNWGCDAIFFFNYNRISMGISNELVESHMDALFGKDRADRLRTQVKNLRPADREAATIEALASALQELGGRYVLPFRFRSSTSSRTSHHLIFVSKNIRGYEIMKEVMARESSTFEQGVPSFEYNAAFSNQGILFELSRPLDQLGGMLLAEFAGKSLRMVEIYSQHHVGRRFIKSNYKSILRQLEEAGKITADPPAEKRKKNTFADAVKVTFPKV